jgi:hypothetical protein
VKKFARTMARRGVKAPRKERRERVEEPPSPTRRLVDAFQDVPQDAKAHSVFSVPDSWAAPQSVARNDLLVPDPGGKKRPGPKPKPRHKTRRVAMSFSVSEEEAFYLRKYAADKGLSFSEWVRVALFQHMKKEIPPRR